MTPPLQSVHSCLSVSNRKAAGLFGLALVLAAGASLGYAQTDAPATPPAPAPVSEDDSVIQLDEFVVSGYRASLTKAIDVKRVSVDVVDSIVAEDIGKFPDNNVVEALQRVTGVQTTDRGGGEVSTVYIRGQSDVTTTVNGRNIFTASGLAVALADIPASLLSRVDVFKTRSADMLETGIAGVIDIRTHRPFDFSGDRGVLAARMIYQEQSDKYDPNVSVLFSKQWKTDAGKFGALVNVSYAETHYRDQSVTAGAMVPFMTDEPADGWTPYERIFLTDGRVSENPIWQAGLENGLPYAEGSTLNINGVPTEYLLSRDAIFASDFTGKRERPAANIALQFAPSDTAEYTFEAFYNGYRNDSYNSLLFSFVDWWGSLGANPSSSVTLYPGTNIIKSRTIGSPYVFTSGDLTTGKTDSYVFALAGKWDLTPELRIKSDLSYQTSEFTSDFIAMRFDRVFDSVTVDFNSGGGVPAFGFGDQQNLTNTDVWNVAQLYDNGNKNKGDALTFTTDGEYKTDWPVISGLKFGVRYDDRGASESQRTQDAFLGQSLALHPEFASANSGFFDGRSAVPASWIAANGYYLRDNIDDVRSLYGLSAEPLVENFNIDEATYSGYLMAEFKTYLGSHKIDGQFGLRYVSVDTDMAFTDLQTLENNSASASTSKALPSFTVRYGITDDLRLRFSYGETLRRPAFSALNPNITYVEDVTNIGYGTAGGGNPNLKPTESKNYDLSLEWYFAESSALYATVFRREIEGLVVDFRRRVTYEGYDYILTQPDNASNGEQEGFELGLVYFPDYLPEPLKGLGIQASYTALDSQQDIPITNDAGEVVGTDTTPFFGVSDSSYSVVLAYEKKKFGMRLSYVWRDDFLRNYEAALFANPLGIYRQPEESLDFQISYNVTDNLALTFDATNLTDEIYQSYYEYPDTHNFGSSIYSRTFAVGARFSF